MSNHDKIFDEIMFQIGSNGKFQKCFNWKYNFFFVIISTMCYFSYVLLLAVPDHWCHVPGRNSTNYTVEDWKELFIPSRKNDMGQLVYDKCSTYFNQTNITYQCQFGWEYDRTWYKETIPSQENWVCEKEMRVTHSFLISRLGEILGTFVLGAIGDRFGRKPVFYIALTTLTFGRLSLLFTTSIYPLFLVCLAIGSLSSNVIYQTTIIIGFEISREEDRSFISLLQCLSWTIGLCTLPLIYWILQDWVYIILVSATPLFLFYIFNSYMLESPRWLASKGHFERCYNELQKICKVNKTFVSNNTMENLNMCRKLDDEEPSGNMLEIFSTKTITKFAILTIISWITWNLSYTILYLNVTNLEGNPFMNFFWQSLAELPGYILGKYITDSLGRKLTRVIAFSSIVLGSSAITFLIKDPNNLMLIAIVSIFLKFSISMAYFVLTLHTMEIFPTSVRQTGAALGLLGGNIFSLLSPYLVYLGTSMDSRIPYVINAVVGLVGVIATTGLPETLNEKLPETIEQVDEFAKSQKCWSFRKSYQKCPQTVLKN